MRVVNLFGDLEKADPCNGHHACPHDDERKTNEVGEFLAWHRKLATCQGGRCYLKKEVELFDQETKCHDGDGSSHPREKCALIGGMIAEIPDHRGSPVLSFPSPGIATSSLRVRKPQGDASLQCPSSCRSRRARARSAQALDGDLNLARCEAFLLGSRAGHLVRFVCLGARTPSGAHWDRGSAFDGLSRLQAAQIFHSRRSVVHRLRGTTNDRPSWHGGRRAPDQQHPVRHRFPLWWRVHRALCSVAN